LKPSILKVVTLLPRLLAIVAVAALCCSYVLAQQTLGGITGEVTDSSGGVIPNVTVTVVGEQTALTRTVKSNGSGVYSFVNLPIGTYTLTYTADNFDVQRTQHIAVQADRTATVNAALKIGKTSETVEVEASPLMNAVDTTNGYVLDNAQIDLAPRGAERRHGRQLRPGQCAHLGQRPARYLEHLFAERRGRQQPFQRQEHQPGRLGPRG